MTPPPPSPATPRRRALAPLGLAVAGLALAALVALDLRQDRQRRDELASRLAAVEIPAVAEPAVDQALRQSDPAHRELAIARAFVGAERAAAADDDEQRRATERLELARRLAAEAVVERPAAWEGSLLLGAATYLGWRGTADPRLATEAPAWELPLERARELAPTAAEPARLSALAYLELWPMLSAEKRELARAMLARALVAGRSGGLVAVWIDRVDDPEEAMGLLPDVPAVWAEAQRAFADRGDWTSAVESRRRWRPALAAELERQLDAAVERSTAAPQEARREALAVLVASPPERLFLPLVERALAEAPAGPPEASHADASRAWLEWALDLALVGVDTLPPPLLGRLAGLAGELPPPLAGRAALAADRLDSARRIEREAGPAAAGATWAAYWIAKARHLAARKDLAGARRALDRVVGTWRQGPVYDSVDERTARAVGDEPAAAAAARRLATTPAEIDARRPLGEGERWVRFALFSSRPVAILDVEIGEGQSGTLLEVQLDGRHLDVFRARPGRRLDLAAEAGAGLHLVEVTAATGRGAEVRRLAAMP